LWQVINLNGELIEQSPYRYNIGMLSYDIVDQLDDGIYEPNEKIFIKNVNFVNNGGLKNFF
jgi:hypothetical protein